MTNKKNRAPKEIADLIDIKSEELDKLLEKCESCPSNENTESCATCDHSTKIQDLREELADLYGKVSS